MSRERLPKYMSVTGQELDLEFDRGFLGRCRHIDEFDKLNRLGEGTYGVVHRARDRREKSDRRSIVALKQIRILDNERMNGIPITALREIFLLRSLRHQNVVNVIDVAVGDELDDVYMVMEYAEQDLANLLDHARVKYSQSEVKCLAQQLFEGIDYLHRNDIIHRDIKMSNLLLTAKGILKIADFGMAREFSQRPLTPQVVTVWYRPPELLFGATRYTPAVDIWSAGMVLGELISSAPVCPGENELDQYRLLVSLLGPPSERIWPKMRLLPQTAQYLASSSSSSDSNSQRSRDFNVGLASGTNNLERKFIGLTSKSGVQLLNSCLTYDPDRRITAKMALGHYFFREAPVAKEPNMMPTFPELRNQDSGGSGGSGGGAGGDRPHSGTIVDDEGSTIAVHGKRPAATGAAGSGVGGSGATTGGGGVGSGYVFDFDGDFANLPSKKRHRAG